MNKLITFMQFNNINKDSNYVIEKEKIRKQQIYEKREYERYIKLKELRE